MLVQPFDLALGRWLVAQKAFSASLDDIAEVEVEYVEATYSDTYGYSADSEVLVWYSLYGKIRKDGSRGVRVARSLYADRDMVSFAATLMNEYSGVSDKS